jgi:cation diffusion facilitator family transporter
MIGSPQTALHPSDPLEGLTPVASSAAAEKRTLATPAAEREKRWVAMTSFWAALGITLFKVVVGVLTGSLGILAEAAHSGLDLVAAGATWVAIRIAGKPADADHPYGHGKVENLSALFATFLLLLTCAGILYGAIERLFFTEVAVEVTIWSFVAMLTSMVVDYSRSRALGKAARKYHSQALEADALHFETDIWSSGAVIVGLICVKVGQWQPAWAALRHADALAALLVAIIALWITGTLGLRTIRALLDAAPAGLAPQIVAAVAAVPGVADCHQVRIRTSGPRIFVDMHVRTEGSQTLAQAHALTEDIQQTVRAIAPMADVLVHAEPAISLPTAR